MAIVQGFSKLSNEEKINWVVDNYFGSDPKVKAEMESFWHRDEHVQKHMQEFSENTLTNFYMPFGIAPNFKINDRIYCLPMVIEESSVVAAACKSAKFWLDKGGFRTEILSTTKIGQVHFQYKGDREHLKTAFPEMKQRLLDGAAYLSASMEARGGGVVDLELIDMTDLEPDYYQLKVGFNTCDAMGANYINTVLEEYGMLLKEVMGKHPEMTELPVIIMCIVSNYTPDCIARATVTCPIEDLGVVNGTPAQEFAEKFRLAVRIAEVDPHRATTHNKGIYNGVDAVILASGNDFRAVEACGHTYAARNGRYAGLTHCSIEDGIFKFWIDLPLAVGTVGGLTNLHPMVKRSFELMGHPDAEMLMQIAATAGLAQNFAALKSMVTVGIQKGHMKMHLLNILKTLHATEEEKDAAVEYFTDKIVSFTAAKFLLTTLRNDKVKQAND
ncbi:MAG: hydroxymethylglutaryl-CoA reductase [Bacteroidetes bacterium]|nr:hydroxymethylglutaryl-CoA reductase [Bacteroidota bacterium]